MKFFILFMATIVAAAPPADDDADDQRVITKKFFPDSFVIYTGKHDIVDIVVPLNKINFLDESEEVNDITDEYTNNMTIFFVEADVKDDGEKVYKGLYVYKNHAVKMVLENGQCATYAKNDIVYFGAKDGIYKYNAKDQTATKYGAVTDSVIRMAVDTENARVYYLTEDHVMYKYNENEIESAKVEAVKDARDMVFDFEGNMFYYDGNNQFYTYNGQRVLKIEGLPAHPTEVDLTRALKQIDVVFAVIDSRLYRLHANGTSVKKPVKFLAKPTAYAPETVLFQYYAYKQKIYLYNLLESSLEKYHEELTKLFEDNEDQLNTIKNSKLSSKL